MRGRVVVGGRFFSAVVGDAAGARADSTTPGLGSADAAALAARAVLGAPDGCTPGAAEIAERARSAKTPTPSTTPAKTKASTHGQGDRGAGGAGGRGAAGGGVPSA